MTSYIVPFIFTIIISTSVAGGMDCSFGTSNNILDKIVSHCPGIFKSESKSYCCLNSNSEFYCCDAQEFALNAGLEIILPAIIGVIVVVTFFVLCITCLCCSCCPWYKRRHRGTVYGKVQTPGVVIIQPGTTAVPNQPAQQRPYQPYTVHSSESSMQYPNQPPPYSAEPYTQQAPYNPNFPQ